MAILRQFLQPTLGHASYLLADEGSRRAIVIDPARHIEPYVAAARAADVEIVHVVDTHAHNDYLSGLQALVAATGATAVASIGASVGFDAVVSWDGMTIELGEDVLLTMLHVPGHTPEHTALHARFASDEPDVLFSGGSLLVGDVGRPDLLGTAQQRSHAARALSSSALRVLDELDDATLVMPTHLGGSLCAGAIGDGRDTTIGEERSSNAAVVAMLAGGVDAEWLDIATLPPVPNFWPATRAANLRGVPAVVAELRQVAGDAQPLSTDVLVLDVRSHHEAAAASVPGAINIPLGASFPVWAGIVAHGHEHVTLIASDHDEAVRANAQLQLVHLSGASSWRTAVDDAASASPWFASTEQLLSEVAAGTRTLVDVRNPAEVRDRPLADAVPVPAVDLVANPDHAPEGPLALACASGYRALVTASVLRGAGIDACAIDGSPFGVAAPGLVGSR